MCEWRKLREWVGHIRENDNAVCILNGDLMDTAVSHSVGDTYGANLQPMEQIKRCVEIFEPIKDKIIAILPGNHEDRIYRSDGIDITELMASQIGLQDRYSSTSALIFLRFGTNNTEHRGKKWLYTVYATHGSGGGRKEGGKINRLAELASIVDADVYIHSHTHLPASFKTDYIRPDLTSSSLRQVTKLFVNTASTLGYGGYGDRAGYKPASTDNPVILLDGRRHYMRAIV